MMAITRSVRAVAIMLVSACARPQGQPILDTGQASVGGLPSEYVLTDTSDWGNSLEDGKRAILRRKGNAIDTVDIGFGVTVVGADSLIFLPVRTDTLENRSDSTVWYESYLTAHVLWTPRWRRDLRDVLPFFNPDLSSPAMAPGSVIYWGLVPQDTASKLYAMRYDFRTARLDSLFLKHEAPFATDYRYFYGVPQIQGDKVSFDHVLVDRKTWKLIGRDTLPD